MLLQVVIRFAHKSKPIFPKHHPVIKFLAQPDNGTKLTGLSQIEIANSFVLLRPNRAS